MYTEKITDRLYRIRIPFEDLTTTVYLATYDEGVALIDSATYDTDIDTYVLPALCELSIPKERVKLLALTHNHGDHGGGLPRLAALFPNAEVAAIEPLPYARYRPLCDGDVLLGSLQVLHLPGHTQHSAGYLDLQTGTLLSGDCLQLGGIGKYRNGIKNTAWYLDSIRKLQSLSVSRIVAAHEFDPLGSIAEGENAVAHYLSACAEIATKHTKTEDVT